MAYPPGYISPYFSDIKKPIQSDVLPVAREGLPDTPPIETDGEPTEEDKKVEEFAHQWKQLSHNDLVIKGRLLLEVRKLTQRGSWQQFLEMAGVSKSQADLCIRLVESEHRIVLNDIGTRKAAAVLTLATDEERGVFLSANNVADMSAKEVELAVRIERMTDDQLERKRVKFTADQQIARKIMKNEDMCQECRQLIAEMFELGEVPEEKEEE